MRPLQAHTAPRMSLCCSAQKAEKPLCRAAACRVRKALPYTLEVWEGRGRSHCALASAEAKVAFQGLDSATDPLAPSCMGDGNLWPPLIAGYSLFGSSSLAAMWD